METIFCGDGAYGETFHHEIFQNELLITGAEEGDPKR